MKSKTPVRDSQTVTLKDKLEAAAFDPNLLVKIFEEQLERVVKLSDALKITEDYCTQREKAMLKTIEDKKLITEADALEMVGVGVKRYKALLKKNLLGIIKGEVKMEETRKEKQVTVTMMDKDEFGKRTVSIISYMLENPLDGIYATTKAYENFNDLYDRMYFVDKEDLIDVKVIVTENKTIFTLDLNDDRPNENSFVVKMTEKEYCLNVPANLEGN